MQNLSISLLDQQSFKEALIEEIKEILEAFKDGIPQAEGTQLLTREEAAKALKVSPITIYRWTKEGRIPCYGLGNRVYYKHHDIQEALIQINS
ncbi:helix-turn-helix domain-containing protein [Muricauda sp. JGD-17]|uniref:Helix-turn-helix domain-containing protein n=1 Tax=Flagellimonas ochracea TaxID=2696472 RepID=A0A964WXC4_9FLAO|nr:helix-turn-helix domain-containing protein [Allomuricauda ochracea]NAY91717.1 helix-turn-helix domain-containing protein [Allomuricauda ochracea]